MSFLTIQRSILLDVRQTEMWYDVPGFGKELGKQCSEARRQEEKTDTNQSKSIHMILIAAKPGVEWDGFRAVLTAIPQT